MCALLLVLCYFLIRRCSGIAERSVVFPHGGVGGARVVRHSAGATVRAAAPPPRPLPGRPRLGPPAATQGSCVRPGCTSPRSVLYTRQR